MRGLRAIGCGCLIVLLSWLFVEVVCFDRRLAFRDVAHFHGPLSRLVQAEWSAGRMPLWNPYVGIGVPLAASPTAAAFYPVGLLATLPLSPGHLEVSYVLLHILLCAGATYALAREIGTGVAASLLAAIAYACGGSVLFQYCNVVFLVGAVWLPVALWATRRMVHRRQMKYAIVLGTALALMTLGGDPQMAYHAGLAVVVYGFLRWYTDYRNSRQYPCDSDVAKRFRQRSHLKLIAAAAGTALVLAAVQWMPAVELARLSTRGMPKYPRNVYQQCAAWFGPEQTAIADGDDPHHSSASNDDDHTAPNRVSTYAALLGRSEEGDAHQRQTYRFSVGPWHFLELCVPNFSGRLFPTNQRWIRTLPGEGRTWVASLYMGLIPALLALACLGRGADRQTRRLLWATLFCLLAACGQYAPGWIAREIVASFGVNPDRLAIGNSFGGVYWAMVNLLPGYETFRYPGKWLIPASLGIALLAAKGWDRRDLSYWSRVAWCGAGVLLVSLVLCVIAGRIYVVSSPSASWGPVDRVFGPLDFHGMFWGLMQNLFHAAVVAMLLVWIASEIRRRIVGEGRNLRHDADTVDHGTATETHHGPSHLFAVIVLMVTTLDLAVAQKPLIGTAPESSWQTPSSVALEVRKYCKVDGKALGVPPRITRSTAWKPAIWSHKIDRDRLRQVVPWDRATLYPLYQLDERIDVVHDTGTMQLADFSAFHAVAAPMTREQVKYDLLGEGTGLDALSIDYFVLSFEDARSVTRSEWIASTPRTPSPPKFLLNRAFMITGIHGWNSGQGTLRSSMSNHTRAWIAHQWDERNGPQATSFGEIQRRTASTLYDRQVPRNLRLRPIVEVASPLPPPSPALSGEQLAAESCRIVHYDPQRVEIEAVLRSPGLVVLADQFYPGWYARVATLSEDEAVRSVDIVRTNRVMRGIWLPAGEHRLEFFYRPNSVMLGAIISCVGWLSLFAAVSVAVVRHRVRQP